MNFPIIFWILSIQAIASEAAKILAIFPTPSLSHQLYFRVLTNALANVGHELTVVTPDPHPKGEVPSNIIEIGVHDNTYNHWNTTVRATTDVRKSFVTTRLKAAAHALINVVDMILQNEEVKGLLKQNFDLIIVEAWVRAMISFTHLYNVPVIRTSSFGAVFDNLRSVGASFHPTLYPISFPHRVYRLSIFETIQRLYEYYYSDVYHDYLEDLEDEMLKRHFGANFPGISHLSKNTVCFFLNVHPIWECNRPVPVNVIYLNGLYIKPVKKLPENLQSYLDSSSNGVIYVSFGTAVSISLLLRDKVKIIIDVLASLPYNVLLKWDNDTLENKPDNFKIARWFPQADILRHPNIKLFISQAGLQSTNEAIAAGVPIISIPILADQWLNAENCVKYGAGLQFEMTSLTYEEFKQAIKKVINESSYKENTLKLQKILLDQPMTALERSIWWTDYVTRHGVEHMRSPATSLGLFEYHEISLLTLVFACCFIVICVFIGTIYAVMLYFIKRFTT